MEKVHHEVHGDERGGQEERRAGDVIRIRREEKCNGAGDIGGKVEASSLLVSLHQAGVIHLAAERGALPTNIRGE